MTSSHCKAQAAGLCWVGRIICRCMGESNLPPSNHLQNTTTLATMDVERVGRIRKRKINHTGSSGVSVLVGLNVFVKFIFSIFSSGQQRPGSQKNQREVTQQW